MLLPLRVCRCSGAAWKLSVQPLGSEPGAILVVGSPWGPALLAEAALCVQPRSLEKPQT